MTRRQVLERKKDEIVRRFGEHQSGMPYFDEGDLLVLGDLVQEMVDLACELITAPQRKRPDPDVFRKAIIAIEADDWAGFGIDLPEYDAAVAALKDDPPTPRPKSRTVRPGRRRDYTKNPD